MKYEVIVYHRNKLASYGIPVPEKLDLTEYECIAKLQFDIRLPGAKVRNDTYMLTNNIDSSWAESKDPRFTSLPGKGQRSTSVGDIIAMSRGDGLTFHYVASIGFKELRIGEVKNEH